MSNRIKNLEKQPRGASKALQNTGTKEYILYLGKDTASMASAAISSTLVKTWKRSKSQSKKKSTRASTTCSQKKKKKYQKQRGLLQSCPSDLVRNYNLHSLISSLLSPRGSSSASSAESNWRNAVGKSFEGKGQAAES